jgi:hypothetical protein
VSFAYLTHECIGDIGNAQKVLNMAGVVDHDGKWSGDVDFFVQTGDIIDR